MDNWKAKIVVRAFVTQKRCYGCYAQHLDLLRYAFRRISGFSITIDDQLFTIICSPISISINEKRPGCPGLNSKQENCELINVEVVLDLLCHRHCNSVDLLGLELYLVSCRDGFFRQTVSKTGDGNDAADRTIREKRYF